MLMSINIDILLLLLLLRVYFYLIGEKPRRDRNVTTRVDGAGVDRMRIEVFLKSFH